MTRLVCLGEIVGAHGVRGEVRIRTHTERPRDIAAYGPLTDAAGRRNFTLEVTSVAEGFARARIPGLVDRNAAEVLKGIRLYVEREKLPAIAEDEFYHADLVGLAAERADGLRLGRVVAVVNFGGGDLLEIADESKETVYLPFTRAIVPVIDVAAGRVVVEPPAGFTTAEDARRAPAEVRS